MAWRYNAFFSYDVEPVEEVCVRLDEEAVNHAQVEWNSYLIETRKQNIEEVFDQLRLTEQLYANALALWEEAEKENAIDKRV